ncbi:FAD/NAD(P)-binding domain-containing protein [Aspergillus saccharolyticus JOP 1030-1]|uniref:AA9 family lytic polysaccharide monooxygenase n=1 Tax=Aspergillus saccharolyticus JOP 1030-1 TaxID=1450539 RepID=A0A318ZHG6_9EURO|nr:FAD/NAD(P)-binding domain-containing protein [Aspergillus saccharolyticus JOP 1030-1]PYH43130.1 FAD/NAD(P)-binding domain-containing protein [Aspergillus saccharolyticus JOP 1030-1]
MAEMNDLVVIGAGLYGLMAAKTYLDVHPHATVELLEANQSVGGVWGRDRLCRGVKTNSIAGSYAYSDFPMSESRFGVKWHQHVPGEVVYKYFGAFATQFDLHRRIRLSCCVRTVEKCSDGSWSISATENGQHVQVSTRRLIVATGLASEAVMPEYPGSSSFERPVLHCKDLASHHELYHTATTVAVVGGSKSAWDAAYQFASLGTRVHWILRKSGHGPARLLPAQTTPFRLWMEKIVTTRFMTWLSPCPWDDADGSGWMPRFLQRTTVGQWVSRHLWAWFSTTCLQDPALVRNAETRKLQPQASNTPFSPAGGFSARNYPPDFFQYIDSGMIQIHTADLDHLAPAGVIQLHDGPALQVDALVVSGGWQHWPTIKFLPGEVHDKMGFPRTRGARNPQAERIDREILRQFQFLNNGIMDKEATAAAADAADTAATLPHRDDAPWRLYRFMVPPAFINDRSIGFAGFVATTLNTVCAQTQALWLTAYFSSSGDRRNGLSDGDDAKLPLPAGRGTPERIWRDTLVHSQFSQWRYPGSFGHRFPICFYEGLPYVDLLLKDLGLRSPGRPPTPPTASSPDASDTDDVICHLSATNAKGHAVVAAGDKISIQWTTWPDSHHEPVISYLADGGASCLTVDKTTLEFFKIDGIGLVDESSPPPPSIWGDDELIANNNSWLVGIPSTIARGYYVLRHELIALLGAGSENGAQKYMSTSRSRGPALSSRQAYWIRSCAVGKEQHLEAVIGVGAKIATN